MHIVVLQGGANSGKTSSIKKLVELLLDSGEGKFICKKDQDKYENCGNFTVPFCYQRELLAITTLGDDASSLRSHYDNYKDYALIYVCAAHPDRGTAAFVEQLKDENPVSCISKIPVAEAKQETATLKAAKDLLNEIDRIITTHQNR